MTKTYGVYIHVPWCRRRCPYCNFETAGAPRGESMDEHNTRWRRFTDGILADIQRQTPTFHGTPTTLFFGGGTPSLAPAWVISEIIQAAALPIDAEVTLEANPEDITPLHCDNLLSAGVNRLSLGVQTFQEKHARLLNRASSVADAHRTVKTVSQAGFKSWSIDLMFSLPNQTLHDLQKDLDVLSETRPPHVSLYGLTAEPDTPLGDAVADKKIILPSSNDWVSKYERIQSHLSSIGLERYEVSNFASQGHTCKHNLNTWRFQPYMGIGPAAHGLTPAGRRTRNVPQVDAYFNTQNPTQTGPLPTQNDVAIEYILGAIRLAEGINTDQLLRTSEHYLEKHTTQRLVESGLLKTTTAGFALTNLGFHVADGVTLSLTSGLLPSKNQDVRL